MKHFEHVATNCHACTSGELCKPTALDILSNEQLLCKS